MISEILNLAIGVGAGYALARYRIDIYAASEALKDGQLTADEIRAILAVADIPKPRVKATVIKGGEEV